MYRDEQIASSLAKFMDGFDYAMIDTCSMMETSFPGWLDIFEKTKTYSTAFHPLVVLHECTQELKKHSHSKTKEKAVLAKIALQILKTAKKNKTVIIVKDKRRKTHFSKKDENFADHAIYAKIDYDHLSQKILLITQDKGLTTDVLYLNNMSSQIGKPVSVYRINANAELVPNKGETAPNRGKVTNPNPIQPQPQKKEHPLVVSDRRLSAVIGNPNYPEEKKRSDVKAQLASLSKMDAASKKNLSLTYSEERLQAWLNAHKTNLPAKVEPKPAPKPAPVPEAKPQGKTFEGVGKDEVAAFRSAALRAGIIIRDPGVPYLPVVHGQADLTTKDVADLVAKAKKSGGSLDYKGLHIRFRKEGNEFQSDFSLIEKDKKNIAKIAPEVKLEEKPAPKVTPKAKKQTPQQPAKKADAPKAEPAKPTPTLIVAIPDDPKKAEKIEQKVAHEKPQATKVKKEAKKAETKAQKQPAKPAPQKAAKQPAKPAVQPKHADAKKGEKPAPKKEAVKPSAPKAKAADQPVAKPKEAPKHPKLLEKAKAADIRLQAVLPNPKYAPENKIKDIQAQLDLWKKLSGEERKALKLDSNALESQLRPLQKEAEKTKK